MSDRDNEFGAYFIGFLIGSLAGAAAALLLAPQSGEETRTIIRNKSIELKDKAVMNAEEARAYAEKGMENARVRAETAIEETRVWADELAKMTQDFAVDVQKKGQVVLEEQKSRIETIRAKGKGTINPSAAPEA
ncbi:MAG: YtxH domain-containing protein [Chloroflexota bacterium]